MKILLTGSSSGIGRALGERLLQHGHEVWGIARSSQQAFAEQNPAFRFSQADASEWKTLAGVAEQVTATWGKLDAIITCAGVQGEVGPSLVADPEKWSATVRANLDATFFAIRAFAALLPLPPARGKIVCFSGGGATKPRPNFSAYAVAKTAVVRLVENLHEEMSDRPIDINAVAPGAINTRLTDEVIRLGPAIVGAQEFAAASKQKEKGGASMERALELVEWLISSDSDGLSGRLLSAPWDPWPQGIKKNLRSIMEKEIYTLRRVSLEDRGLGN